MEPEFTQDTPVDQRNTRTLMSVIIKQTDYRYSHGILVKMDRSESRHEQVYAAFEKQQKEVGIYRKTDFIGIS